MSEHLQLGRAGDGEQAVAARRRRPVARLQPAGRCEDDRSRCRRAAAVDLGLDPAAACPEPQHAVVACGGDQFRDGVEGDRPDRRRMLPPQDQLRGEHVADLQVAVASGRGQPPVVGRKGDRGDRVTAEVVQEVFDRRTGGEVPDADHAVRLADGEQVAVVAEGEALAAVFVRRHGQDETVVGGGPLPHALTQPPGCRSPKWVGRHVSTGSPPDPGRNRPAGTPR